MSGIAGIVHFDGAPVKAALLRAMAGVAPYRGPDGVGYWPRAMWAWSTWRATRRRRLCERCSRSWTPSGIWLSTADARLDNRDN